MEKGGDRNYHFGNGESRESSPKGIDQGKMGSWVTPSRGSRAVSKSRRRNGRSQMKRWGITGLFLFVILSVPFSALAEEGNNLGLYVGVLAGVSIPADMNTNITGKTPAAFSVNQDISLDTGWLAGAKVGYLTPFTKRILAVELEYYHVGNGFDSGKTYPALASLKLDGNVNIDTVMFNLIGRYPEGRIHPYVGGGVGYAYLQVDKIKGSLAGTDLLNASSGSDNVFAYQILGGVNYDITKNWFAGLEYKFFHPSKATYDMSITSPFAAGSNSGTIDVDYTSHNIVVILGYQF
jgi:opacity protein-like surface antigen